MPYAKHLPFHAIDAYPLVWMFGTNAGMKLASLLGGFWVLVGTYLIIKDRFSLNIALATVLALTFHHGFVWMTVVGSADLLFAALFLFGLWAYNKSEKDSSMYLLAGVFWGFACLTRYNGVPLLGLYLLYGLFARSFHRKLSTFWIGFIVACGLFGLWLVRNILVFGNPLHTEYSGELSSKSPDLLAQFISNIFYYVNPLQNILPILFIFSLYGIWKFGKKQILIICSIITILLVTSIWWVQAMRFAFPAYPLILAFAIAGLFDVFKKYKFIIPPLFILIVISHAGALCMYNFGSCNAFVDKTTNLVPKNLGLTSEGFYAYKKARDYINANAEEGAYVLVDEAKLNTWAEDVYRSDLILTLDKSVTPLYFMAELLDFGDEVVFITDVYPKTLVIFRRKVE
ncbi:MAG: glycosyltransferase family 39 protein [Candidatus Peribacteraceae bacterium]|nr:glycosyltransferase family 39 protein [Candidatus Peribacteraceae bacterium]